MTFSILMVLYVVNCGINYRRVSFSEKSGIETTAYTVEDLKQACLWLTEEVNTRAGQVKRDENGVMMLECAEEKDAVNAMQALGRQYPALAGILSKTERASCIRDPFLSGSDRCLCSIYCGGEL